MLAGVLVLALAIPLACWGLAARTARTGWIVALVLASCAVVEIVVAKGWLWPGQRFTAVVAFAFAAAMVVATEIAAEWRQAGGPLRAGARVVAGVVLSAACVLVSLAVIAMFLFFELIGAGPRRRCPRRPGCWQRHRQAW
jgi:hypothetical protein